MIDTIRGVRQKLSNYQAILYILSKPENQTKFKRNPELVQAIESGDVEFVRNWFKSDLDSKRLNELRDLASRIGIYPVYGRTRDQLIMEIQRVGAVQAKTEP